MLEIFCGLHQTPSLVSQSQFSLGIAQCYLGILSCVRMFPATKVSIIYFLLVWNSKRDGKVFLNLIWEMERNSILGGKKIWEMVFHITEENTGLGFWPLVS